MQFNILYEILKNEGEIKWWQSKANLVMLSFDQLACFN